MAKYTVTVIPDPFAGIGEKVADYIPAYLSPATAEGKKRDDDSFGASKALQAVGRPLHGIKVKPNTPAFAQVLGKDGKPRTLLNLLGNPYDSESGRPLVDHVDGKPRSLLGKGKDYVWTDWFLQTVREERIEKTQLLETFGDSYLFAFGQKPRTLVFQGTLMNSSDFNWRATFWENWEQNFRATKLIENEARMYVGWDDILVEGYPINAVVHQVADSPNAMVFSFTFFVTKYINLEKRNEWKSSRAHTVSVAPFRYRIPPDSPVNFSSTIQELVRTTGLRGVNEKVSELTSNPLAQMALNSAASLVFRGGSSAWQDPERFMNIMHFEISRFVQQAAQYGLQESAEKLRISDAEFNMWFGYVGSNLRKALGLVASIADSDALADIASWVPSTTDELIMSLGYASGRATRGISSIVTSED